MKYLSAVIVASIAMIQMAIAQPAIYKLNANSKALPQVQNNGVQVITPVQAGVLFKENGLSLKNTISWLADAIEMRQGVDELRPTGVPTSAAQNLLVSKFSQYYNGIKVEHGVVNITSRNEATTSMQLEFYAIPSGFSVLPALTEAAALQKAASSFGVPDAVYLNYGKKNYQPVPKGELVIVRTYENDSTVCLAWKFSLFIAEKLSAADVYIDAQTGKTVFVNSQIKHENRPGQAATRYSGTQTIVTDSTNADPLKPYRLRQARNSHNIITLNYQKRFWSPSNNDALAIDFTDNDNNWEATEHNNTNKDDAALDVQFNMQIISDYWKQVHGRNSWDNNNSPLRSYVHVEATCDGSTRPLDNAFWFGSSMYFGDGSNGVSGSASCYQRFRVLTSLDVTAHEVGHGITQATNNLIYRWESGALNEGLSDIWGALIEQWGKDQYPTIASGKSTWLLAEEISSVIGTGIRDMKAPGNFQDPSAYNDPNWKPSSYPSCIPANGNDQCGVHSNSGVINKWFYLITMGEAATNTLGQPYNVTGMGFTKSTQLIYLTTLNLTPNACYNTAKVVSLEAAANLFGNTSPEFQTVQDAWRAVGVDSAIWNISNTPVFAANNNQSFLCISMGKNNTVWAGTDRKGLYVFDGTTWAQRTEITNVRINDIKNDRNGGIWVGQSGTVNTGTATGGGVNYFASPTDAMTAFYSVSTLQNTHVPTRNIRSVFVDKTRNNGGTNPRVWVAANTYTDLSGNSICGKPAVGLNGFTPGFTTITSGIETTNTTGGPIAIGGNGSKVWVYAPTNFGKNQIIAYNAATNALIGAYDYSTVPVIPVNPNVKAIYTDPKRRTWFGLNSNALLVYDENNQWHYVSIPSIFTLGTSVNFNAITGSPYGDVYIGTTGGLLFFDKNGSIDNASSYAIYRKANGLPSSNITGIAYDKSRFKLWVATDQGICRWDPLCIGNSCQPNTGYLLKASTIASGNWSDTAVWENNIIPDSTTEVFIEHDITVDINADCHSLTVLPGGSTTVNAARKLTIYKKDEPDVQTGQRRE